MNKAAAIGLILLAAIGGKIVANGVSSIAGDLVGDIFWGLLKSIDLQKTLIFLLSISSTSFSRSSSDLAKSSKSHPELAKALAVALPIPLEAPVINTVDKKVRSKH